MRNFIFMFVILSNFIVNAQSDTIISTKRSVIAFDKVKTVYRGIYNPISIAVSDCKSFKVEGIGVTEVSNGKYNLSPGQGTETKILVTVTNFDGSISIEEHSFTVANMPMLLAKINNQNCYNCVVEITKEEIINSVIGIGWNDVKIDLDLEGEFYQVKEFDIVIKRKKIKVIGNKFSKEALIVINKLKAGAIFSVENIRYPNPYNICRGEAYPIKIRIKE